MASSSSSSAPLTELQLEASTSLLANLKWSLEEDSPAVEGNLENEFDASLGWLLEPAVFPGRIPGFENTLKPKIGLSIAPDRAQNILQLSALLHLSEEACIRLLTDGELKSARTGRTALETAVQLYDELLLERIECLKLAWEELPPDLEQRIQHQSTPQSSSSNNPPSVARQRVLRGVQQHLKQNYLKDDSSRSLLAPILEQIALLQSRVVELLPGAGYSEAANVLKPELKEYHLRNLRRAERDLVTVLYKIARVDALTLRENVDLVQWLKARTALDEVTVMMLAVALTAIQSISLGSLAGNNRNEFVKVFTYEIIDQWNLEWMPFVLALSWGLLLDAERDAKVDYTLPPLPGNIRTAAQLVRAAIDSDAFGSLLGYVLPSDDKRAVWEAEAAKKDLPEWTREEWPLVQADQRWTVLAEVQSLVQGLVGMKSNAIQTLQRNEWDAKQAAEHTYPRDAPDTGPGQFPKFIELVIGLYNELPADNDLGLWQHQSFLAMLGQHYDVPTKVMVARLLLSIGNGVKGSRFLQQVLIEDYPVNYRIDDIFRSMLAIVESVKPLGGDEPPSRAMAMAAAGGEQVQPPTPEDFEVLAWSCKLLVRTFRWHPEFATKIVDSASLSPIHMLWQLVNRPMPSTAKAAVLDTLAAFCRSGIETSRMDICSAVWVDMERTCLSHSKDIDSGTHKARSKRTVRGVWLTRLEKQDEDEKDLKARQALIRLFAIMIQNDRPSVTTTEALALDSSLRQSIVDYVVQTTAEVAAPAYDQAQVAAVRTVESIAKFIENGLVAFDPDSAILQAGSSGNSSQASVLALCTRQPGYHLIETILTNPLIFRLVSYGAALGHVHLMQAGYSIKGSIKRATESFLRSLVVLFKKQRTYLEVLLPSVREDKQLVSQFDLKPPSVPTTLERQLALVPERVAQIATYVTEAMPPTLAALAIDFLSQACQTDAFQASAPTGGSLATGNMLVQVIVSSQYSKVILSGMVYRLSTDANSVSVSSYIPSQPQMDQDLVIEEADSDAAPSCQMAVLGFLLKSVQASALGPNVAHFFLGYLLETAYGPILLRSLYREGATVEENKMAAAPEESIMRRTCLHVLIEELLKGVPVIGDEEISDEDLACWRTRPLFAERALKLVSLLSASQWTSSATVRYLRGQENFVLRLLSVLDPKARPAGDMVTGDAIVQYDEEEPIVVWSEEYARQLRFEAVLLELAAFDLHSGFGNKSYARQAADLLLVGSSGSREQGSGWTALQAKSPLLFSALVALTADFTTEGATAPNGLFDINFAAFQRVDEHGCTVHDVDMVDKVLTGEIERLQRLPGAGQTSRAALEEEATVIKDLLYLTNCETEVNHAAGMCLSAWTRLANTVVTKAAPCLPSSGLAIYQLARVCLVVLTQSSNFTIPRADFLSEICMLVSSTLAFEGGTEDGAPGPATYTLPLEHVNEAIRLTLSAVMDDATSESARGAFYNSLMDYLSVGSKWLNTVEGSDAAWQSLWRAVDANLERLVGTVARDALSALDVWKTMAYNLLNLLLDMSGPQVSQMVEILDKNGFLQSVAYSLQTADRELTAAVGSNAYSRAIVVYEAKMAFLLKIVAAGSGGTRLARAGILHLLGRCEFLGARPEMHDAEMDAAEETAQALSRYLQLATPALRLTLSMLQSDYRSCYQGTIDLITNQTDGFVSILTDVSISLSPERLEPLLLLTNILDEVKLVSEVKLQRTRPKMAQVAVAVKGLPSRFWSRARWEPLLSPTTEADVEATETIDVFDGQIVFVKQSDTIIAKIQSLLLKSFIACTSNADLFEPVFTVGGQLYVENQTARTTSSTGAISLSQAAAMLQERTDDLLGSLELLSMITHKLGDEGLLTDGEIDELAKSVKPDLDELTGAEKQALAMKAIAKAHDECRDSMGTLLTIVEASLILINRHISFYSTKINSQAKKQYRFYDPKSSTGPSPDLIASWKAEINGVLSDLRPVLDTLRGTELAAEPGQEDEHVFLRALVHNLAELKALPLQPTATA